MAVLLVTGCMYSGKTTHLIKTLKDLADEGEKVGVFKPVIDARYSLTEIVTHQGERWPADRVSLSHEILERCDDFTAVAIDEVQFFDEGIISVIEDLKNRGLKVILAGLDRDWKGDEFPIISQVRSLNPFEVELFSNCEICGEPASRTQRMVASTEQILIGSEGMYTARCLDHHTFDSIEFSNSSAEGAQPETIRS